MKSDEMENFGGSMLACMYGKGHQVNLDFTNVYTFTEIIVDPDHGDDDQINSNNRYWTVGIYDYDSETDVEVEVGQCNNGDVLDFGDDQTGVKYFWVPCIQFFLKKRI